MTYKIKVAGLGNLLKHTWLILVGGIILAAVLVTGLVARPAREGDTVTLHYSLKLVDGSVYFTSRGQEPLKYMLGENMLIPGFEEAVIGMRKGDSKTVTVPFAMAYGPYRPDLVAVVGRSELPAGVQPVVGQQLKTTGEDGNMRLLTVTEVTEAQVTFDGNSPLAGLDLTFDIELLDIEK